jgi:hypothetical protein
MWKTARRIIEVIKIKFLELIKGGYFSDENNHKPNGGHFA